MNIKDLAQKFSRVSLRTVLIVPFVLQIFVAVGLTGYLSLRNGQKAVNDLADRLSNEVSDRTEFLISLPNRLKKGKSA